eukprot:CAMPEP_0115112102 /NCGR_PEP_ID=MMETSP0227-20121206/40461_1 /TAXON_ID=89957 /ORGANISM="Polarella glacialis, Strain CCMP 1383" /LENGTH=63 /DNA_ID=CAMNT_0002511647 /DNA_START=86 /DNA_END=274 /DNA_ORIENTATION=+
MNICPNVRYWATELPKMVNSRAKIKAHRRTLVSVERLHVGSSSNSNNDDDGGDNHDDDDHHHH